MNDALILLILGSFFAVQCQSERLARLDADPSSVTVSGISAGGAMAVQLATAYSGSIKGYGSFAGVPYYCAKGTLVDAMNVCMYGLMGGIDVSELIQHTNTFASAGDIDATSNLASQKAFLLHGNNDNTVVPETMQKIKEYNENYRIQNEVVTMDLGHGMPTEDYGVDCTDTDSPYINKCQYKGAHQMLQYLYGDLQEPSAAQPVNGQFLSFDQQEFAGDSSSFHRDGGFIYIPSFCRVTSGSAAPQAEVTSQACEVPGSQRSECGFSGITERTCGSRGCCWRNDGTGPACYRPNQPPTPPPHLCSTPGASRRECGFSGMNDTQCYERGCCWKNDQTGPACFFTSTTPTTSAPRSTTPKPRRRCRLHVALHGCLQSRGDVQDRYARNAGYLPTAELNNIIILFPQMTDSAMNPNACFDWWGYEDENYAKKNGKQMKAIKQMIDRVARSV